MDHFTKARTKIKSVAHFSDIRERIGSMTPPGSEDAHGYYGGQEEEQGPPTSLDPYGCERVLNEKKNKDRKKPLTRPSARPQQPTSQAPSFLSQNSGYTQPLPQWSSQGSLPPSQHSNSMQGSPPNTNPLYPPPSTPVNQQPQAGYDNQTYNGTQGQAAQYYGSNQASSLLTPGSYAAPANNQPGYQPQYAPQQGGYHAYALHEPMGVCVHGHYVYHQYVSRWFINRLSLTRLQSHVVSR
jgi:hypothetical protein